MRPIIYSKIVVPITVLLFVYSLSFIPVYAQGNTTTPAVSTDESCVDAPTRIPIRPFPEEFLFIAYQQSGGFSPSYERIAYDSLTGQLVTGPRSGSAGGFEIKSLNTGQEMCLIGVVNGSGFFEAQGDYPPIQGATDFLEYRLAINSNNRTHIVSWTDQSEGVPPGILNIVKEIHELAAR